MQIARGIVTLALTATLALSACGGRKAPNLMNIRSNTQGPDEFTILPGKPLEAPENYASLPAPTPGGANITDPTPLADAVAALGGNPARLNRTGVIRGDNALVAHTTRFGVASGIRQTLATEDLTFRSRHRGRVLERAFNVNTYFKAYRKVTLDEYAELARMRRLGVRTPSAPPDPTTIP